MRLIKKQIVTDEAFNPVAVIINYQDWQRIEALLQQYDREVSPKNGVGSSEALGAYAGSIKLTLDPLEYQREARNAWL
jgi:hypothetical protein